jgi:NAD(P)-dependent dehydrogenase (short-subunit alcohol dehydrogenase family)
MNAHLAQGRHFFITGANSGIGFQTALQLAKWGGSVTLASRSREKNEKAMKEIAARAPGAQLRQVVLNLADLKSVRKGTEDFLATGHPVDVLINNAGLAGTRSTSPDGYELTVAVNHLGHFLLTELLLPRLKESAQGRIINVSSRAHFDAKGIDWSKLRQPATGVKSTLACYAVSKLMNVLHTKALAKRLSGTKVTTYAVHPGVVATRIWRRIPQPFQGLMKLFMVSEAKGAETTLYCATAPELAHVSGRYYTDKKEVPCSPLGEDEALAEKLFEWSQAAVTRV